MSRLTTVEQKTRINKDAWFEPCSENGNPLPCPIYLVKHFSCKKCSLDTYIGWALLIKALEKQVCHD